MRHSLFVLMLLLSLLSLPPLAAARGGYTPHGLYDAEGLTLDNGFQVLLKPRRETRSVAFRLVVNVGTRHFDCDRREMPHLLEHLLFSGTSRHTEGEQENLIADLGGTLNAETGAEHTVFQLDIFDRNALQGLEALHEIVTEPVIDADKLAQAKTIVYREEGGRPKALRRFLYRLGIGKTAWQKANEWLLPGSGAVCPSLVNMEEISVENIKDMFRSFYPPGNMALIVVGNFDRGKMLGRITKTFGAIAPGPKPPLRLVTPPAPREGPATASSTLTPFFGTGGSYSIAFRTAGRSHADAAPLIVLSSYLNAEVYEQLRVNAGLSYAPEAEVFFQPDYGIFYAAADAGAGNSARVEELMNGIFEKLRTGKLDGRTVEQAKKKVLLQWAQECETNGEIAARFAEGSFSSGRQGGLLSYEREIQAVSSEDLDRSIARYFRPELRIGIRSMPTIGYSEFFTIIAGIVLLIALAVAYRLRKAARLRKSRLPEYIHRR